jgi:hypothetical protein
MKFMEMTGKGDFNYPMFCATNFLNMLASVTVGVLSPGSGL